MHCTLGDVLIGVVSLALALAVLRQRVSAQWNFAQVAVATTVLAAAYTVFSEWLNVTQLGSWTYAAAMPRIPIGGFELGLTPLLQWLVLPGLSLWAARSIRP